MVNFLWQYDVDGLFFKRCDTDIFWTNVTIASDAIICIWPSLTMFLDVMVSNILWLVLMIF